MQRPQVVKIKLRTPTVDLAFVLEFFPNELLYEIAQYAPVLRFVNQRCHSCIRLQKQHSWEHALQEWLFRFADIPRELFANEWWLVCSWRRLGDAHVCAVGTATDTGETIVRHRNAYTLLPIPPSMAIDVFIHPRLRDLAHSELVTTPAIRAFLFLDTQPVTIVIRCRLVAVKTGRRYRRHTLHGQLCSL